MILPNTLVNYYFEQICAIPHISNHEQAIAKYICSVAEKYHHKYILDKYNNVIVFINASKGYEDKDTIIFQGHSDMVPTKKPEIEFDFLNDPIQLKFDGHILKANGTTLGADDGVAVAIMLALMSDDSFSHPALECIFTTMEETGTDGAEFLDISMCKGNKLINLDGNGEFDLSVGCYCSDKITLTKQLQPIYSNNKAVKITINGFEAYGQKIHPAKLLMNILKDYLNDFYIVDFNSGTAENMPTIEVDFTIISKQENIEQIIKKLSKQCKVIKEDVEVNYHHDIEFNHSLYYLIHEIPNENLKNNENYEMISMFLLGIIIVNEKQLKIVGSDRCLNDQLNCEVKKLIKNISDNENCTFEAVNRYVSWQYQPNSVLKDKYTNIVKKYRQKDPIEKIVPGGLEVTDFLNKNPNLEILALGCNCGGFHTTDEWLDVDSFNRLYDLLTKFLEEY